MGKQAQNYAGRFLRIHNAVLDIIRKCPETSWSNHCPGENESIGAVANHIAAGYQLELALVVASLEGKSVPEIYEVDGALDTYHAQASQSFSRYSKRETLEHLRKNGEAVHRFLCDLDNADLVKPVNTPMVLQWFGQPISVEGAIQYLLIGHPASHLTSIRKAIVR